MLVDVYTTEVAPRNSSLVENLHAGTKVTEWSSERSGLR